ncbi:diguanylate cyclase [Shewanella sp. NIFS-20-20]|uniref:GGDEF domain-containing response regulator n=1 Tax=Shewanella sp. NIFS-20-20 TaxID=2853806 RepID=UPI001C493CF8|nr:diguanylate cyclase [Shewanella sp. NIFS-20-20]MBV7317241.1 diguanylate cyclase [Shewanella sp. NIFS-20-20]
MNELETVLIVDDIKMNQLIMSQCLKGIYQVKVAQNGQDCIQLANMDPQPDLILLDVMMPEFDGYQVCRQLKENPNTAKIPIIFVTGKDSDDDEQYGLEIGAVDYITKPIRPAIVKARVAAHIQIKNQRDALQYLALHDALTGLFNRYFLEECAQQRIARFRRHNEPMSVVMFDIDNFKMINDTHGHDIGDKVLQGVAKLMTQLTRKEDVVARMGGEEFVILMDCPLEDAVTKTQSMCDALAGLMPCDLLVTASFGVTAASADFMIFADLVKQADIAVYQAKYQGKNQVVCHASGTVDQDIAT